MTARPARIVVLPGDGIGPEVTRAATELLGVVAQRHGATLEISEHAIGGDALRRHGEPLPKETLEACLGADAVLLGAVGDPEFDSVPRERKPETGLLALRKALGVFANIRPARVYPGLENAGPLKPEVAGGIDLVIVRELLGGLYFGEPRGLDLEKGEAVNTLPYTRAEITRVAEVAFRLAVSRRGDDERGVRRRRDDREMSATGAPPARATLVTSVDKANVLETSMLWRHVTNEVGERYPQVRLEHQYVDSCAMSLVSSPSRFDVLLTENLFGDILSDQAGALVGSLGLLPSASLGTGPGLFEPVHGSAPTLAGKDVANPVGAILSAAMLLRDGLRMPAAAADLECAVEQVLYEGARTADLAERGKGALTTSEMARAVRQALTATALSVSSSWATID